MTLQRGKTITLVINTSRGSAIKGTQFFTRVLQVLTGTAWKCLQEREEKSGKRGSVYSYLTDREADALWASHFHRYLVMTALQLAWCKLDLSDSHSPGCCEDAPRKDI